MHQAPRDHYGADLVLLGGVEHERSRAQRYVRDADGRSLLSKADGCHKNR